MKYLKYGFFSIVKKPLFNVLIMLELAAILVVGNLTIATANSRSVFYDPYADIMSKEGYVYQPRPTNGNYDKELRLKTMYDSLAGDVSVRYGWCFQAFTDDEHFIDPLFDNDMTSRNIYAFDVLKILRANPNVIERINNKNSIFLLKRGGEKKKKKMHSDRSKRLSFVTKTAK